MNRTLCCIPIRTCRSVTIGEGMQKGDPAAPSRAEDVAIDPADALWLLSSFAALHQTSCDLQSLARECVGTISIGTLTRLGDQLGLDVSHASIDAAQFAHRVPLVVQIAGAVSPWAIVLAVDRCHVTVIHRGDAQPTTVALAEFSQQLSGSALLMRAKAQPTSDPDSVASRRERFGFGWFVPELLKYKPIWRDVLVASLVLQAIALAFPLFTQVVIDKVVVHRTQSTLVAIGVGMAVFVLFTGLLSWVRQYLILHTGNRVDAALGTRVFGHLVRLPAAYFQHRPTGIVAARLQGIETIREFISSAAVTVLLDLPFLLLFVAVMFWYSVTLTLVVLAVLAVIVGASALVAPLFQRRLNEQFLRGAASQAFTTEYIAAMETVKSLQLEPQADRRYGELLGAALAASFRTRQLANTYATLANTLEQGMTLLILVIGAYTVMTSASFTVGMLVAFQMFSQRISQPVLRLVGLWQQFHQARIAVARLGDVMNAPAEPYSLSQARAGNGAGIVDVENLSFRYADNLPLLYDGFSFKTQPGHLVAIMGPSGAGKSTLAKLLQGFYQPSGGSIRIDGTDIRYLAANQLRSHFGIVPQDTTLFAGTILDNLKLASPHASFEQVVAAARMAEIHSVIEALPNGYQTMIGERGAGLSGGQRQRIAIARALLKGPKILVFDEATSSLDGPTAEQLGRTISALRGRVTILFIAHVLPKSLQIDQIVRLGEKLSVVPPDRRGESTELMTGTANPVGSA